MLTTMSGRPRTKSFDEVYREIASLPSGVTGQILEPGVVSTMPRPGAIEVYEARDARPLMVATARDDERPVLAPFGVAVPLASFWLLPEEPRVGAAP